MGMLGINKLNDERGKPIYVKWVGKIFIHGLRVSSTKHL